jgi:hypothetical protein
MPALTTTSSSHSILMNCAHGAVGIRVLTLRRSWPSALGSKPHCRTSNSFAASCRFATATHRGDDQHAAGGRPSSNIQTRNSATASARRALRRPAELDDMARKRSQNPDWEATSVRRFAGRFGGRSAG